MLVTAAKLLAVSTALSVLFAGAAGAAGAQPFGGKVRPNQVFAGVVNGQQVNAVIKVVCPVSGTTGRILHGQNWEVTLPEVISINDGNTGALGTSIVATLGPSAVAKAVVFKTYNHPKPLPNIPVPCSGSGKAIFTPAPGSPSAKAAVVNVTFANVAA